MSSAEPHHKTSVFNSTQLISHSSSRRPLTALAVAGLEYPHQQSLSTVLRGSIHLLVNLKVVHNRGEFAQDLVCLLVELQLRGDQVREVAEWLWGVENLGSKLAFKIAHKAADTHILHDTNSLLGLANELILSLLNLKLGILRGLGLLMVLLIRLARELEHATLSPRLRRIKQQSRVLDAPARPRREHQVGVEGSVPSRQETGLDLCILREPGLANLLAGKGILLERGRERVLAGAGVLLLEELAAGQGGAGNGVGEGLGLGLGDGGCSEGGLGFGGGGGGGEELDLLADAAAEIGDVFADVGVVVALVGVLCSNAPWSASV